MASMGEQELRSFSSQPRFDFKMPLLVQPPLGLPASFTLVLDCNEAPKPIRCQTYPSLSPR
jgi:hypothetical protein